MKKIYLLLLSMVLSLATAGFSYAYWTDTLSIGGTAETGELEVVFTQEQEIAVSSIITSNNQVQPKQFTIQLDKLYPGAIYETSVEVENSGTIPAVLDYAELLSADQNELSQYVKVTLEFVTEPDSQNPIRTVTLDQAPLDMLPQLGLFLEVDGPESTGWINVTLEVLEDAPNDITENKTVDFTLQLSFVQFNGYNGPDGGSPGNGGGLTLYEQIAQLRSDISRLEADLTAINLLNTTLETENSQLETELLQATPTLIMFQKLKKEVTDGTISLDIELSDIHNTIDKVSAVIYDGITEVAELDLVMGVNNIKFDNLLSSHKYVVKIEAEYVVNNVLGLQHVVIDEEIYNTGTSASCFDFDRFLGTITDYHVGGVCTTDVSIPKYIDNQRVTTIGYEAFQKKGLTSITIPNSVTSIEDWAFSDNYYLTSVTLPESVVTIGDYAFHFNLFTTSITIPDSVIIIGDYAFSGNEGVTSVTIPGSVRTIGDYAFAGNMYTVNVTFENGVTTIGKGAFSGNSLTGITLPDSLMTIGDLAFECNNLTSVEIPDSVTTIGDYSFEGNQLTTIIIPDSVTTIGRGAFANNPLTSVNVQGVSDRFNSNWTDIGFPDGLQP